MIRVVDLGSLSVSLGMEGKIGYLDFVMINNPDFQTIAQGSFYTLTVLFLLYGCIIIAVVVY